MYSQSPLVTAERGVSMRAMLGKGADLPRPPPTHPEETEEELTETNDMQEDDEGAGFHRLQKEGSDDSTPSSECVREDHGMMHVKGESTESELDEEEEDEDIIQLREEDEEEEERGGYTQALQQMGGFSHRPLVELSHRLQPRLLPSNTCSPPPDVEAPVCVCGTLTSTQSMLGEFRASGADYRRQDCWDARIRGRKASLDEIQCVHSEFHTLLYGTSPLNRHKLDHKKLLGPISQKMYAVLPCGGIGLLQQKLGVGKILIVDWDIHHGNGTQQAFYSDPSCSTSLCIATTTGTSSPAAALRRRWARCRCGLQREHRLDGGVEPPMGDVEYLTAFRYTVRSIVMPGAQQFSPDVVLVSAGFDAVEGHQSPLGGTTSPPSVCVLCSRFWSADPAADGLAGGRVVMALEGGHDLTASVTPQSPVCPRCWETSDSVFPWPQEKPCPKAWESLERVIEIQKSLSDQRTLAIGRISGALGQSEKEEAETVIAMGRSALTWSRRYQSSTNQSPA
ncbi:hypothetical protein F7725_004132, partial [Dissostichus mawsoni]